jgi:ABC-type transport system involved in multi-copper enzyme maturation permease subunit
MKKTLSTLMLTVFVVLITATFSFAEYAAAGAENFPYFHLGALIVGGMTILSLKQKYEKLYMSEAVGSFAMFAVMVALFTSPVAQVVKNLIG